MCPLVFNLKDECLFSSSSSVSIVQKLRSEFTGRYVNLRVLHPVHIASLKQAYPSQREGTLFSPDDATEYAAWQRPRLQIEDVNYRN